MAFGSKTGGGRGGGAVRGGDNDFAPIFWLYSEGVTMGRKKGRKE